MSKVKKRWITIISLFAALFLILGLALGLPKVSAFASNYAPTSIFSAGTGGEVGSGKESDDAEKSYVQFTFSDNGKVHFRRDLALKWYEGKDDVKYFSMTFSFGDINFKEFTIEFESAEENISKDGKATNSIAFTKKEDGGLDISVNGEKSAVSIAKEDIKGDITIALDEDDDCKSGEFAVLVNTKKAGTFENIGGYYLEYRSSSSSTPNTPITFTATFDENAEETDSSKKQSLFMKSLNKQSMVVVGENNRVDDNAPAVLVLNDEVYSFKLGQKFSLSYKAIDVCDDSVSVTREYYMLKTEGETNYLPNEKELKDEEGEGGKKYSAYNYKTLTTSTYFLPSQENDKQVEWVSIRFRLNDDTKEHDDTYVYLSWYAAKNVEEDSVTKLITGIAYKEVDEGDTNSDNKVVKKFENETLDFIKVDRQKEGPYYNYLEAKNGENKVDTENETAFKAAVDNYKKELEAAAEKTSAGTGAYIYLPSLRDLIKSDFAGYRNLKFSIYYYKEGSSSASSQTSLSYNALKIEVTEKGVYKFRVLAQDASSNAMQYYLDGELVTVSSSNIWDIEGIPEFTFEIDYTGPTIEETEEQSLGYRNDTYNFGKFDVVALTGYQTKYKLYRYDSINAAAYTGNKPSSYSDFVKNAEKYFKAFKAYDDSLTDNDKKILHEISPFDSDVDEDDEAKWNRTDNDYYWDPDSSLSFVPQETGFYILTLNVEDSVLPGQGAEGFQVVEVRNPIDTIPSQSQWLEENVVSVVLFAISGVLAIIVVVLFLVKPSEKKVEGVDLEKLKGKKKKTQKK
ncbi:MAG: hypothetical protein HDP28_01955 [Clostridia bacterium]|nr:hypothetical protein [Clostridia bacterium]